MYLIAGGQHSDANSGYCDLIKEVSSTDNYNALIAAKRQQVATVARNDMGCAPHHSTFQHLVVIWVGDNSSQSVRDGNHTRDWSDLLYCCLRTRWGVAEFVLQLFAELV